MTPRAPHTFPWFPDRLVLPAAFDHNAAMLPNLARLGVFWARVEGSWLAWVFVLAAAPVLVFFSLVVPAGESPDEVAHILRADSVRHGQIAGFRRPRLDEQGDPAVDVAVRADTGLLSAGFAFLPTPGVGKQMTKDHLGKLLRLPWANRLEPVSIPNTAVYPPVLYVPAAAGMQAAKWLGQGPYVAILAARLANAAAYLVLGTAAICSTRRGRAILFALLCLPMSLSLAASVNHDGLIIGCASLAGALLTRLSRRAWWYGAAFLGIATMAKPYLLPLALVVPMTFPGSVRHHAGRVLAGFAVATLPALLWAGAMAAFIAAPFVRGPAQPGGPLWAGQPDKMFPTTNPGEQLHVLLAAPGRLLSLPLDSIAAKGEWLWREFLGVLGILDIVLPTLLYTAWGMVLASALLAGYVTGTRGHNQIRLCTGAAVTVAAATAAAVSAWCVFVLQYLSWTRVGEALVDGIQGRYFISIAVIALPMMAVPVVRIAGGDAARNALAVPAAVLALLGIATMPLIVLRAYYLG